MRKVFIDVKCRLILNVDEGVEISKVMQGLDTDFAFADDGDLESEIATIEDQEIVSYEITDSK